MLLSIAGCAAPVPSSTGEAAYSLRLIGRQPLAHDLQFGGTTVGGLSGIDYDAAHDLYYVISDDRSAFAPTRFYTAKLSIDADRFGDAALQTVVTLMQPDGTPYPTGLADAEAIRFDPATGHLWWTSEGRRKPSVDSRSGRARLDDPFIRRAALDGRYVGDVPLDAMFRVGEASRGPRDNLAFEGATLSIDGRSLWVSMEGPLLQEGPMPTITDGAWSRISRHDRDANGGFSAMKAQFAYRIDPVPARGALTSMHAFNGVSEILAIDATKMLVLERAFVLGGGWRIRLFEADWTDATDVRTMDSFARARQEFAPPFVPMQKRLIFDFEGLPFAADNLEGLCFGPTLANGHRTLVLVSDNNFNAGQTTQFIAFEVVPR